MEKQDEFEDALEICPTDQGSDRTSRDELDQVISVAWRVCRLSCGVTSAVAVVLFEYHVGKSEMILICFRWSFDSKKLKMA